MAKMICQACSQPTSTNWGEKDRVLCSDCYWSAEQNIYEQKSDNTSQENAGPTNTENNTSN
ncbi:MAG: hypothetical protein OEY67_00065 [Gammaproteobacteria bacterium]|nr:hypothetical protein [Gammaproteobacteria bacterium]